MDNIRIGNTFEVSWAINQFNGTETVPYDLAGKDLTLILANALSKVRVEKFSVIGNIISFTFEGKDQRHAGKYSLILIENNGVDGMHIVDVCDAFRLVNRSCETCDDPSSIVDCTHIDFASTMLSRRGISAYEYAKLNGYEGTEEEYAADCRAIPELKDQVQEIVDKAAEDIQAAIESFDKTLQGKQDTIEDLETIRSGAANGATAAQPSDIASLKNDKVSKTDVATINGKSIINGGNITIEGKNYDDEITALQQKDKATDAAIANLVPIDRWGSTNMEMMNSIALNGKAITEQSRKLTELSEEINGKAKSYVDKDVNVVVGDRLSMKVEVASSSTISVFVSPKETTPNIGYRIYGGTTTAQLASILKDNTPFGQDVLIDVPSEYNSITIFAPSNETSPNVFAIKVYDSDKSGLKNDVSNIKAEVNKLSDVIEGKYYANQEVDVVASDRISMKVEVESPSTINVSVSPKGATPNIGYRIYAGTASNQLATILKDNIPFGQEVLIDVPSEYTVITIFTPTKETSINSYTIKVNDAKNVGLKNDVENIKSQINIQSSNKVGCPVFVGDYMPKAVKEKIQGGEEDVLIAFVGDSITGLTQDCEESDKTHYPPTMSHRNWVTRLWENAVLNKPLCDRLDSIRGGANVITQQGFSYHVGGVAEGSSYNTPSWSGEYSIEAETFQSSEINSWMSFILDTTQYKKCNIVFSMSNNGAETAIEVAEGNGKLLASLDRKNWVEANGYSVSQNCNPLGLSEATAKDKGVTFHQRHRRIWLKVTNDAVGTLTIKYKRIDADTTKMMYVWGVEKWNGQSIFMDNLGRGGRPIDLLMVNSSDISDRYADLVVLEMPLANETGKSAYTKELIKTFYNQALFRDNIEFSYISQLNNYEDTSLLVVLPHGRTAYYDGNHLKKWVASGDDIDMLNYLKCKFAFSYICQRVAELNLTEKVRVLNLLDLLNNESIANGVTIEHWNSQITSDGIHLNDLGSMYWVKYLQLLFQ